jgi:hypothetical protein
MCRRITPIALGTAPKLAAVRQLLVAGVSGQRRAGQMAPQPGAGEV